MKNINSAVSKYVNSVSSVLIAGLTVLAIYQTNQLWFKDSLSRNFFYILSNQNVQNYSGRYDEYFTMPYRIITGFGNNQFDIKYSDIENSSTRDMGDKILYEAAKNGQYVDAYVTDYETLLRQRSIVYEYAFNMKGEFFTEVFSGRNNMLNRAEEFNSVYIIPQENSSNIIHLFFQNDSDNIMYQFTLDNIDLCDELRLEIQNVQRSMQNSTSTQYYYVSSKLLRLDIENNIFIPRWRNEEYATYFSVRATTSYSEYEDISIAGLRKGTQVFFDNPSSVWEYVDKDERITFSDSYTVVKYYEDDILYYNNYRTNQQNKGASLIDDFNLAMDFIRRDTFVDNEFYLAGYNEIGSMRTFYFDYVINDAPVIISDLSDDSMNHAIEIIVIDGTLTRYKKLAYTFEIDSSTKYADLDILALTDDIDVHNIRFGYKYSKYYNDLSLNVIILDEENKEFYSASVTINREEPEF